MWRCKGEMQYHGIMNLLIALIADRHTMEGFLIFAIRKSILNAFSYGSHIMQVV